SELFGHRKGAFSGAIENSKGAFERCHNGVLFLDEVADLPAEHQVALLRTLQEGTARPIGAHEDVEAAPRVVSATYKDMEGLTERDSFRIDLYHRLSSVIIRL